jgi:hypothetical protein
MKVTLVDDCEFVNTVRGGGGLAARKAHSGIDLRLGHGTVCVTAGLLSERMTTEPSRR